MHKSNYILSQFQNEEECLARDKQFPSVERCKNLVDGAGCWMGNQLEMEKTRDALGSHVAISNMIVFALSSG